MDEEQEDWIQSVVVVKIGSFVPTVQCEKNLSVYTGNPFSLPMKFRTQTISAKYQSSRIPLAVTLVMTTQLGGRSSYL